MDPATKTSARRNRPYILQINCHLFIRSVSRDYPKQGKKTATEIAMTVSLTSLVERACYRHDNMGPDGTQGWGGGAHGLRSWECCLECSFSCWRRLESKRESMDASACPSLVAPSSKFLSWWRTREVQRRLNEGSFRLTHWVQYWNVAKYQHHLQWPTL